MALSIREPSLPFIAHSKFGLLSGYIIAINTTIGAGVLSIPWAFATGGWLFGLLFQLLTTIQGYYLSQGIFESMSRAEVLQRMTEEGKDLHHLPFSKLFSKPRVQEKLILQPHLVPIITNRMISCADIARLGFGEKIGKFFFVLLFLSKFGVMIAYGAIFAASFASNVPIGNFETCDIYSSNSFFSDCKWKYWFYLLIFSILTGYLTVKGIEEQEYVQIATFILRFLVMIIIIITSTINILSHSKNESAAYNPINLPPMFAPEKFSEAIPVIAFASAYQIQIPTISKSVNNKTRNLPLISNLTIITCMIFYNLLGILASFAIPNVPSLVSLSYRNYSAGHSISNRPAWTYIIEYVIVISPAIDVLSSYPFQALTIADAVVSWKYGDSDNTQKKNLYAIRFFIAFSPLLVSFFAYNLGQILEWVGLVKFLMIQCFFPLIHIGLRHIVNGKSPYQVRIGFFGDWAITISNLLFFVFVVIMNSFDTVNS